MNPDLIVNLKCSYADRYKATRPPSCGCIVCALKWHDKAITDLRSKVRMLALQRVAELAPEEAGLS
jgi:hypothetical protein